VTLPTVEGVRELLRKLIDRVDTTDQDHLLGQARSVSSISGSSDHVRLHLKSSGRQVEAGSGLLPVIGNADDAHGEPLGEFLVRLEDGRLSSIEFATYLAGDDPWPPLARIRPRQSE
jgi:hypothetical protein